MPAPGTATWGLHSAYGPLGLVAGAHREHGNAEAHAHARVPQRGAELRGLVAEPDLRDPVGDAGLGLWKIYANAAVMLVDVSTGHSTSVTAIIDIDIAPR